MTYSGARAMLEMGVSRPTLYQVVIPGIGSNDYLRFFCKATFIPEVKASLTTVVGHDAIGIARDQPTRVSYGKPFEITIIENSDFSVYKDLRTWFDSIATNVNNASGGGPNRSLRMNYFDAMVRDITLFKLENPKNTRPGQFERNDDNERKVLEVTFRNAFPTRMSRIALGSDLYDSATEFTAAFTYQSYDYE